MFLYFYISTFRGFSGLGIFFSNSPDSFGPAHPSSCRLVQSSLLFKFEPKTWFLPNFSVNSELQFFPSKKGIARYNNFLPGAPGGSNIFLGGSRGIITITISFCPVPWGGSKFDFSSHAACGNRGEEKETHKLKCCGKNSRNKIVEINSNIKALR